MRQLDRFNFALQLSWRGAAISRQMTELRRLRELVRLAERRRDAASTERANSQSENRRSDFRRSTASLASVGACRVLTKFLRVDPDSEILLLPVDMADAVA